MKAVSRLHFVVAAFAAASCQVYAQVPNCARSYVVQPGDTCDTIGAKNHVPSFQLETANSGKIDASCDNLKVGELLCLGIIGQDCEVTQVVKTGDNCESIATVAATTVAIMLANNPNVDSNCDNLHVGEVLCTADDIIVVQKYQVEDE
ncbi:hypothetical protein C8Q78DRAFT_455167 [Trametes maxima]|nr:hypothetical protein C8Q78DRAFT_455167 [Trametes maxima]